MNDINWLASQNNFQFDPQLFGAYRESQESVIANPTFDGSFFNDAFDVDFTTPYNMPTNLPSPGTAAGDKKPVNLIDQIDAAKDDDDNDDERIGSNGQLLTCNKIWYVPAQQLLLFMSHWTGSLTCSSGSDCKTARRSRAAILTWTACVRSCRKRPSAPAPAPWSRRASSTAS